MELVIEFELVHHHHHLQREECLHEFFHLMLLLDQCHDLDRHQELDFNLEGLENLVVQLLLIMMVVLFHFLQLELE